jgi:hypothetical protein
MADWTEVRKFRFAPDKTPDEWPPEVRSISINGVSLFGIHEKSGKLYWDGAEVVTRTKLRLATFERWIASFAAIGTFGTFLVNVGRAFGWWH